MGRGRGAEYGDQDSRYRGPGRFLPSLIGALLAGKRPGDGLIRLGAGALLAWRLIVYVEERDKMDMRQRAVQHDEIIQTMREQVEALDRLEQVVVQAYPRGAQ